MNDKVVNGAMDNDPDEVQRKAYAESNRTEENQEDTNKIGEHLTVQNHTENSLEKSNSSDKGIFFLSRPLPLKDPKKPAEGPTIKTDVHDFFSLFPINEANISDLIGNITRKLHTVVGTDSTEKVTKSSNE